MGWKLADDEIVLFTRRLVFSGGFFNMYIMHTQVEKPIYYMHSAQLNMNLLITGLLQGMKSARKGVNHSDRSSSGWRLISTREGFLNECVW